MAQKNRSLPDIECRTAADQRKLILLLMWPALAENLLATFVSIADTVMVSVLGTLAVNGVGLVTQPRFIVLSAFMALGVGTTSLVARAKGEGDPEKANRILWQSLMMAMVMVIVLSVLLFLFNEPLIRMIAGANISEETIQMGVDYFRIQIYGFPVLCLTFIINAALRGAGNTKAAFYSNTASNLVNVCLNYCLISGNLGFPALGVEGASIATVAGQCVAFIFCLTLITRGKQYIRIRWKEIKFRFDKKLCASIARIGLPAMLEQVIMRAGMLLFTLIVTSLGDTSYSTHIIAMNIQQLSFTTGMSFGTAATTLTGQCLGRKRVDLAKAYVRETQRMGYMTSFVVSALLFFFGGAAAMMYTNDPVIIAMAGGVLQIVALSNPLSNARFVYNSALRGAGDSKYTARITFAGILLTRPIVAVLTVYVFHLDLTGVWIALVSDALVCYFLARRRWFTDKWATIEV